MSVTFFSPFGLSTQESGLVALLANYCQSQGVECSVLRCNGLFSLCDRDSENGWKRPLTQCLQCGFEQRALAEWGRLATEDFSRYLTPEDVERTKRWCEALPREDLWSAVFGSCAVGTLCRHSFVNRFGTERPDVVHRSNEQMVRRMLTSCARAYCAGRKYSESSNPTCFVLAGGQEFISAAMWYALRECERSTAIVRWDISSRSVRVWRESGVRPARSLGAIPGESYDCPIVFEDVTSMRPDPRTWPREILRVLDDVLVFIGVNPQQLSLPLAAQ